MHRVTVKAEALDDLLHGALPHQDGTRVAARALVLLHLTLPLGLERARAAVVRLLVRVHDEVAPQVAQIARHVRTLLAAQRAAAAAACRRECRPLVVRSG